MTKRQEGTRVGDGSIFSHHCGGAGYMAGRFVKMHAPAPLHLVNFIECK